MVDETKVITYQSTTTYTIDRFVIDVEIDDMQDISYLDGRHDGVSGSEINHPDPEIRGDVRTDAIMRARHGKDWGQVGIIVRSRPDNVVRASLWGIDVFDSETYRHNVKARERADAYFGEILSDLLTEARDQVHAEHVTDSRKDADRTVDVLPVVDPNNAPVDAASLRDAASTAIDWWAER